MRRRSFLRTSLVAGAGAAAAPKALAGPHTPAAALRPIRLQCEYQETPLGVDVRQPRFSWMLESVDETTRNQQQGAFRIRAASSPEQLDAGQSDLWDTGRIESDRQLHVVYDGKPLSSMQRVYWSVEVWSGEGAAESHQATSWFEMGLLERSDWKARWIGNGKPLPENDEGFYGNDPAPLLRRSFRVFKPVRRARLYATALGYLDLRLNGSPLSDAVLDPAWTSTKHRIHYRCHDITDSLIAGENVVGAMLGNGWRNPLPLRMWGRINLREHLDVGRPALLCQVQIEYMDGTQDMVASDGTWRWHDGPILRNSVYLGEHVDGRLEPDGWDRPGLDDSAWNSAVPSPDQRGLKDEALLQASPMPPIRATRTLRPVSVVDVGNGVWIFDLGQNFAGWAQLRVQGPRGTTVRMRMGELLYPDGTLNPMTAVAGQIKRLRDDGTPVGGPGAPEVAWQENVYTLKGGGEEVYTPRFTFHGFRYVEVTGYPGIPGPDAITGLRLNSDIKPIGSFHCSNPAFNRIKEMVDWTLLSNVFSVQSDCPAREKFQYGGDIVSSSDMAFLTHDMATFYAKAAEDFRDDRASGGWFTETAPFVGIQAANYAEGAGPIGWGLAHPLLLEQLLQYAGNNRLLEGHYAAARNWVELLEEASEGFIIDRCIGDHESLDPKPIALVATAQFHQAASMVAGFAERLGLAEDAVRYDHMAREIRDAFVARFLSPGTGVFDSGTQAAQATALFMGLVPEEERQAAINRMVEAVIDDHDGHIAAGIFGTKYLLRMLTETGHADVAYAMVNQPDFPGWRHMMSNGATTLWETWAQSDNVYSQNHPMFGSVSEWLFRCLGGINPADDAVGFDRVRIAPFFAPDLDWVESRYDSVRGPLSVRWERKGAGVELSLQVPAGMIAEVHLQEMRASMVMESGHPITQSTDVDILRDDLSGAMEMGLGSGTWVFEFPG